MKKATTIKALTVSAVMTTLVTLSSTQAIAAPINLTTIDDGIVTNYNRPVTPVTVSNSFQSLSFNNLGGDNRSYAVFNFDLSSILDTDTITSAMFNFALGGPRNANNPAVAYTLDAFLGNGVVDIADFGASGTVVGVNTIPSGALLTNTLFSTGLTNLAPLQSALVGNNLTIRMLLDDPSAFLVIAAEEHPTNTAAYLTIMSRAAPNPSPVPLPATLPLLLVGLGAIGIARRKHS